MGEPATAVRTRWAARRDDARRSGHLLRFDLAAESFDWHDSCGSAQADGDSRMTAGTDPFEEGDDAWLVGMPAPDAAPDHRPGI